MQVMQAVTRLLMTAAVPGEEPSGHRSRRETVQQASAATTPAPRRGQPLPSAGHDPERPDTARVAPVLNNFQYDCIKLKR
jgi:hypothetical protein